MKTPRFFLSAAVLFWGWQMQTLWIAVCLAVLIEFARSSRFKFKFTPSEFNKFVDISILFLAGTIVIALTIEAQKAIWILLKWLPLVFYPIIAVQEFSAAGKIDSRSFFPVARRAKGFNKNDSKQIDISFFYSFFCILSAGTAPAKGHLFYLSVALFFVWALWQVRSRRVSVLSWGMAVLAAVVSGYILHTGIHRTGMKISQWAMTYYANFYDADPFKSFTALGEIATLKLSDKIVFRATFQDYTPGKSYLLQTATFNKFVISNWFSRFRFKPVEPLRDKTFWQINPREKNIRTMTIYFRPAGKRAVLCLPPGVISISEMKAFACEKNAVQSVRIEDGPSLIKCVVSYTDKLSHDAAPTAQDFFIPQKERPGIARVAKALELENKSETQILKRVKDYFLTGYTYSLRLRGKQGRVSPLQNFLFRTKAGHCEFFATATALILRQAKLPARYVTGYRASEYSSLEDRLIIRQKDAHAWVKVYINGQWENFDTTPPSFFQADRLKTDFLPIKDLFSFVGFQLSRLRHETGAKLMNQYGVWLVLPLGIILFLRLRGAGRIQRIRLPGKMRADKKNSADKISFGSIEQILSQKGFPRYPHETYLVWLNRIGPHIGSKGVYDRLHAILRLHNKSCFSESGLKNKEADALSFEVKHILKKISLVDEISYKL